MSWKNNLWISTLVWNGQRRNHTSFQLNASIEDLERITNSSNRERMDLFWGLCPTTRISTVVVCCAKLKRKQGYLGTCAHIRWKFTEHVSSPLKSWQTTSFFCNSDWLRIKQLGVIAFLTIKHSYYATLETCLHAETKKMCTWTPGTLMCHCLCEFVHEYFSIR